MSRVFFATCRVAIAVALSAGAPALAADRPNVVVLITDDQGYGDLSCHGNPVLKTPNLDRLHSQSVRLTDFHACPMCTPTRGQLLTAQDCLRNGAMNVSSGRTLLHRGIPTVADAFAAGGYRCGQFGKWHLGDNYPYRPQDRGFHETLFFPSSHVGSAPDYWENDYFDDTYLHNGQRQKYAGYCTDVFFGEAMKWMKGCAEKRQPFLCYLATNAPHGPLFVPARYREPFEKLDVKPNVARFFGMIANIDENVGKLDAFLRDNGLAENTIVVFLTDNGGTAGVPVFNAGMRGRKIDLYDGGHRVPCFVRWPGGKLRKPGDVAGLTTVQDILPTLLDLCGVAKPEKAAFDGVSLAKVLRGEGEPPAERMVVVQFSRMNEPVPKKGDACVLWKRWRLVADKELFDLAADPEQKANVIDKHAGVAAQMRGHYEKWWAGVSPKVNDHEAIVIGSDAENPLLLSPADWEDSFLDQGAQVRAGLRRNGAWNVEVAKAGEYEVTLRRWAAEADTAIRAGRPVVKHADGQFPAGVALPVASARLKVGDFDATSPVGEADKSVTFAVKLPAGRTKLRTWFLDADDKEIAGAYYVTVRRK
jgi:arylsulfatase A-like enzyme